MSGQPQDGLTLAIQKATQGPALDAIAARPTDEYIRNSLLEPGKDMAKGFEHLEIWPLPLMGDSRSPQELADVEAFMRTLK